jgi:hypothetical protein
VILEGFDIPMLNIKKILKNYFNIFLIRKNINSQFSILDGSQYDLY